MTPLETLMYRWAAINAVLDLFSERDRAVITDLFSGIELRTTARNLGQPKGIVQQIRARVLAKLETMLLTDLTWKESPPPHTTGRTP